VDFLFYTAARIYAQCYVAVAALTGYQIPGLGLLLRQCRRPKYIRFLHQWLYFEPSVASSYGLHIIGRVHEPETHAFLNAVFDSIDSHDAVFIDVGANIGAFVLDISRRPNVRVIGFEPAAGCVVAIRKSIAKNGRQNVSVYQNLVGDREALVPFAEGKDTQGASVLTSAESSSKVQQLTLDQVEPLRSMPATRTVLMIDVEGYEPQVLRGARVLIERVQPLLVFEYNWVSKQHFNLADVQAILGDDYQIFRLRKDALLDNDVENAWNCVAVPRGTDFEKVLKAKVHAAA
jgi:FkbM family methyltransferase